MSSLPWSQTGLHVIAKPIGPLCNLSCDYCFYLRKDSLYAADEQWRMSDETLEAYVKQYIEAQAAAVEEIAFAFQGGEPTLLGIDFFRQAVELQKRHCPPGKRIHNSLQTNCILLDDRWCEFLAENDFLVGVSIDGPGQLHDKYRHDKAGRGTFDRVVEAVELLKKHGVEFNTLTCINGHNAQRPKKVYRFLRDLGIEFMQFIPIVERMPGVEIFGDQGNQQPDELVSRRSVHPGQFGRFLCELFDQWVAEDVGRVFVRDFDQALAAWVGVGADLCVYTKQCGRATAIEHNGDLYSCDHFVDAGHKLGNIHQASISELANSPRQEQFARHKEERLPGYCRRCPHLFACNGACPKDRILSSPDGQPGLNYLCEGYKTFFEHIDPHMKSMAEELAAGRPPANVMRRLRANRQRVRQETATSGRAARRNDPCPCGSGRKFKSCCMRP